LNHGTAVAGVIAARDNDFGVVGVAPGVRIWNIKCFGPAPYNSWSLMIKGMNYVYQFSNQIAVASPTRRPHPQG
jgi:subtilisin family serine protease